MAFVAGYAVVNDVTARELIFRRDGSAIGADWLSGKSFPTFLPFGPMIVPRECVADPYDLNIRLSVNGKVYQDESTADMMASIERQIAYLSSRVVLEPGARATVGTGLAVAIPEGYAGYVQPRSGLAARHGITIVNAPGLVDSGYRGELRVILLNTDREAPFTVEPGMRIAQLVVLPVPGVELVEVDELPESERGVRGFGSSAS